MYLYDTIFNYTHSLNNKVNLSKKKGKRPNLYNKKILNLRHSDSLIFSLFCDTYIFFTIMMMKKESESHTLT